MNDMQGMSGPHDMKRAMAKGMEAMQKMPMTRAVDKDFAMMMKVHHQQALNMAETELQQGSRRKMSKQK